MRDMFQDDGRLGTRNFLLAVAIGAFSIAALWLWGVPGLDPSLWDETAVAAGLRPPQAIFPGIWRFLTGWCFSLFGVEKAVGFLNFAGIFVGGGCVALFYLIVRQMLALLIRFGQPYPVWYNRIAPFFSLVTAYFFAVSDPFTRLAHTFSPGELRLAIFLLIVHLLLRWFVIGGHWRLFPAMALCGVLAAETPFAFLLPLVFAFAYVSVWHCILDNLFPKPEHLPEPEGLPKWRMLFLFLGGLAFAAWANVSHFISLGGLEANGWSEGDIYFRYAGGYWHVFADAASLVGWVLGLICCLLPFVVALRVAPLILRDDRPMSFNLGVVMFFVGFLAMMQSGAFPSARFWTYTKEIALIQSDFLLVFFVFVSMLSLAIFGAAFTFECQRTYLDDEAEPPGRLLKATVPLLMVALVAFSARNITRSVETEMQAIVDDAVSEIVAEAGDAKWIFTDGHLDTAIEIQAAVAGKNLKPLNMMSGASEWDVNLRCRGFEAESEDRKAVETGVPILLRIWAGEKPNGLDEAALQLGFEFWKRERKPLPKLSGLVARTSGLSDAVASNGVERAAALSKRILALAPMLEKADPTFALESAFSAVNWRLARFARLRNDEATADELDLSNGALKKMMDIIEYERLRTFMQMTPREGLELALKRADFTEARRYSTVVLRYDDEDPQANFGLGMYALLHKDYKKAELYLRKCLVRRPEEPAVLNNLSILCRKTGRYAEAEKLARQALKILPDSPEVKKTLSDALKKAP